MNSPTSMANSPYQHLRKLRSTAESGDANAQWELGYYYENGLKSHASKVVVVADPKAAIKWYTAAAKQGNSSAQAALGVILSSGGAISRDLPAAICWLKMAIAQGDCSGAFNLATIYRDMGKAKLAFRWYEKAAAMGDNDAYLQIGLCRLFGFGARQDFELARASFHHIMACAFPAQFSQRSNENARYWLAILDLIHGPVKKGRLAQVRSLLETANADDDHEQANELLNLIGKTHHLAAA